MIPLIRTKLAWLRNLFSNKINLRCPSTTGELKITEEVEAISEQMANQVENRTLTPLITLMEERMATIFQIAQCLLCQKPNLTIMVLDQTRQNQNLKL